MSNKVSEVIIDQLSKWGIDKIYGYAGDTILKFFSALQDSPIKLYTTRHEGTAGMMASAQSKMTGKIGVCVAHSGPGTANIINGIADAYSDRTPLLLITGQVATYNIGTNYKQFINQLDLTDSLTVFSSVLIDPEAVVDILVKAITMAISKGGVSHIVIPMNLWDATTNALARNYLPHLEQRLLANQDILSKAQGIIDEAQKPVILYGRGVKQEGENLLKLAQKIGAPLINSLAAKGIIDDCHPLSLGGLGHGGSKEAEEALKASDLIIILGSTWWPMDSVPRRPKVLQFDICKENIGMTHPVELGVVGDLKLTLEKVLDKVSKKNNKEWENKVKSLKEGWKKKRLEVTIQNEKTPIDPRGIIKVLSENLGESEIITLDSGDSVIWFAKYFTKKFKEVVISGTWRTMGFALPAALTAKINNPQSPVTCIIGDGGIEMVLADILTGLRYNLPIRVLVINNGWLAMEKNKMHSANLKLEEVGLNNPDFAMLARSCGAEGIRVNTINELKDSLEKTENLDKITVIDIITQSPIPAGTKL
ncbi:thiamine pyrophosphate-binding protein [Halonatronum saccharophilum]|uniref:thiamine pyrophosphate-binding protein n=1 Tax=Halonatronum saccharophilum TaxID=150060 RepID=UPI0004853491|nr:thiamine pyrophosphate-binding protein [Halonatronum saccharophilum]